jgi:hypothetical protein
LDLYYSACEYPSDYESDDEDDAFGFSVFFNADHLAHINVIAWAEYETKDGAPTAFAATSNNEIFKIVFKDFAFDVFSHTIPGISPIDVLKSHSSTKKLFAITHHGKMFTIDWTEETPVMSPEIDLTTFWQPGPWRLQIVDDERVWVGQEHENKVYLFSWKSPLQPLAVVDLKDCHLRDLQSVGSTCVISVY